MRSRHHGLGDAAREGRSVGTPPNRQPVVAVRVAGPRLAVVGQIQRDLERALDPTRHVFTGRVLGRFLELGDLERRRRTVELGERVVAEVEHALGQTPSGGDGEVPREVEIVAFDVDPGQVGDHALDARAEVLDLVHVGRHPVTDDLEDRRRGEHLTGAVAQIAQSDHVAVALVEVDGRPDHQRLPLGVGGIGVELGPERHPDATVGIEQDDRRIVRERRGDVRDRRQLGGLGVQAGDHREHRRAGAEAVQPVPLGRVDGHAGRIGRHLRLVQRELQPVPRPQIVVAGHRFDHFGEAVAGIGQEAGGPVEQFAAGGLTVDHVGDGGELLG